LEDLETTPNYGDVRTDETPGCAVGVYAWEVCIKEWTGIPRKPSKKVMKETQEKARKKCNTELNRGKR